ncbi:MAG: FlgD immunoglobulin-like domain containing protein [bacterium]
MVTRNLLALAMILSLSLPEGAVAQWATDGNPVCTSTGAQNTVRIISDGSDGAYVVWADQRGGLSDIYARRIGRLGGPLWTSNGVALCTAANAQVDPHLVRDTFGALLCLWEDYRNGNADLYRGWLDISGGTAMPLNGKPLVTATGAQTHSALAIGEFQDLAYAAWTDARNGNNDIYARPFDTTTFDYWGANGLALCTDPADQDFPAIASSATATIVAWEDFRNGNYDIYAQRPMPGGTVGWAANGVAVCTNTAAQVSPMIVSSGTGAIIAWNDRRHGTGVNALYAQRVDGNGVPQWAAGGIPLAISTNLIILPRMIPDGSDGAILVWEDDRNLATTGPDIFAQRVTFGGAVQWGANGLAVCTAPLAQSSPDVSSDESGGAIVTWQDVRVNGPTNVYAQRVSAAGAPLWTANGIAVCVATGNQFTPAITTEQGAAYVAWEDRRSDLSGDVYAQRIDVASGQLGLPQAWITSIVDVPNDEGGFVRLAFQRGDGAVPGDEYEILDAEYHGGDVVALVTDDGSLTYTVDVLTEGVGVPNHYTVFGRGGLGNTVAGTSIDNLAPPAPTLTGGRNGTNVDLAWNVTAADVDHWSIFRSDVSGVYADVGTNSYSDLGVPTSELHYQVRGVDVHGNVGALSNELVVPATSTAAGEASVSPRSLALRPASPNPFSDATSVGLGLPRAGDVTVELFDAAGRRVATRSLGRTDPGWQNLMIDGRDDAGRPLGSGVYFCRVSAGGETRTTKVVVRR